MWTTILRLVGSPKVLIPAAIVLVVIWTSWLMIQYGKNTVKQEILIEQQGNYITTRKRIDDASRSVGDADAARERLLKRQSDK